LQIQKTPFTTFSEKKNIFVNLMQYILHRFSSDASTFTMRKKQAFDNVLLPSISSKIATRSNKITQKRAFKASETLSKDKVILFCAENFSFVIGQISC